MTFKNYTSITQKHLKECLVYNEKTGIFTWKVRPIDHFCDLRAQKIWNTRYSGKKAGTQFNNGSGKFYLKITISYKTIHAHRIAWMMVRGEWPLEIDHSDGNGLNNKWLNLSNGTHIDNCKNTRIRPDNKSGVVGVSRCCKSNRWIARIGSGNNNVVGRCIDFFEAVCARKSAEIKLNYHKNHGSNRPL